MTDVRYLADRDVVIDALKGKDQGVQLLSSLEQNWQTTTGGLVSQKSSVFGRGWRCFLLALLREDR